MQDIRKGALHWIGQAFGAAKHTGGQEEYTGKGRAIPKNMVHSTTFTSCHSGACKIADCHGLGNIFLWGSASVCAHFRHVEHFMQKFII